MVRDPLPHLFALVGDPVAGNPTQEVVEAAFRSLGLDWRYVSCHVAPRSLARAMEGLRALGFTGAHVTVPHKVVAATLVDELSPGASSIGAVNCIEIVKGRLVGHNTDGLGLVSAIARTRPVADMRALIFGAGGVARAIGAELVTAGAREIRFIGRDPHRLAETTRVVADVANSVAVSAEPWPAGQLDIGDVSIVINATTIGMHNETLEPAGIPVDWATAARGSIAADVVIRSKAPFATRARQSGLTVVTGMEMLVEQAVLSIEIWTGETPDRLVIQAALEREIGIAEGVGR